MTIDDIRAIFDSTFWQRVDQNSLVEENWPDKTKTTKPYKKISLTCSFPYLLLKLREGNEMFPFFQKNTKEIDPPKNLSLMCDYLVFMQKKDMLYVLFIELKGSDVQHAKDQIQATECFWNFISATASRIGISTDRIKTKKLIIKDSRRNKSGTAGKPFSTEGQYYTLRRAQYNDSINIDLFVH